MKIVFVSSGQPSANPRLVKEVITLHNSGYDVTVIYCPLSPWADSFDKVLFEESKGIRWVSIGAHPLKDKIRYLYARMRMKYWGFILNIVGNVFDAALRSTVLYSKELEKEAKVHQADLYIGHNLGAISAVVKAARKFGAKASFDFEDFHRGEVIAISKESETVKIIEDRYVPVLNSATTASPMISEAYKQLYPFLEFKTINNCFSIEYAQDSLKNLPPLPLKLFWFSQFIGKSRGLETVIEAMGKLDKQALSLTLLGNASEEIKNYFLAKASNAGLIESQLLFHKPVPVKENVNIASMHHIGLACEVPHIPNRELCLTNKIFIYLLAGNAIIFSSTKSQVSFWEKNKEIGGIYENYNADQLAGLIQAYIDSPGLLNHHRSSSLQTAIENYNWDIECKVLLETINKITEY